jgi:hypothetical protein
MNAAIGHVFGLGNGFFDGRDHFVHIFDHAFAHAPIGRVSHTDHFNPVRRMNTPHQYRDFVRPDINGNDARWKITHDEFRLQDKGQQAVDKN